MNHNVTRRFVMGLVLALCARVCTAQEGASQTGQFLAILLPVMVVLGTLLIALIWLNKGRGLYRSTGPLKLVQVLAVTSRERVVVLDAGKRMLVVGVASGRVSLLSMLDPEELPEQIP
ncbi:MAG: FliO/MopB family protein [Gammaproteobacteria bacterium]